MTLRDTKSARLAGRPTASTAPENAPLRTLYSPPTPAQIGKAAYLGFATRLRDEDIARRLGIVRRTLARWKLRPDYEAATVALNYYCRQHLAEQYGYPSDPTLEADAEGDW